MLVEDRVVFENGDWRMLQIFGGNMPHLLNGLPELYFCQKRIIEARKNARNEKITSLLLLNTQRPHFQSKISDNIINQIWKLLKNAFRGYLLFCKLSNPSLSHLHRKKKSSLLDRINFKSILTGGAYGGWAPLWAWKDLHPDDGFPLSLQRWRSIGRISAASRSGGM